MRARSGSVLIVSILLVGGFLGVATVANTKVLAYLPHEPIRIGGNSDFSASNGIIGGNGSSSNPYLIEGWLIEAKRTTGLVVSNTDAHFIIRDVHILSGGLPSYGISFTNVTNGQVQNSSVSSTNGAVFLRSCQNVNVTGNTFTSNAFYGVHVFLSSAVGVKNNTISGSLRGVRVWVSWNVLVEGNHLSENSDGISIGMSRDVLVDDNIILRSGNGMVLWRARGIAISRALIRDGTSYGIYSELSSDVSVSESTMYANDGDGLHLVRSSSVNVSSSTFFGNDFGIYISDCTLVSMFDVFVQNNPDGLHISYASHIKLVGSTIISNWLYGVIVKESSDITISHNVFDSNGFHAMNIYNSTEGTVTDNAFLGNKVGVHITDSDFFNIYHNDFIGQDLQAYSYQNYKVRWDGGYPFGGNYWSDYSGLDNYSGSFQDVNGSDGIGDTPKGIPIGDCDYYPLMSPYTLSRKEIPTWQATSGKHHRSDNDMNLKTLPNQRGTSSSPYSRCYGTILDFTVASERQCS